MTNDSEKLIDQLLNGETSLTPELTNDLLDEFWNGLPVENLKSLLLSGIPELERGAAFILSELSPEIDQSLTGLAAKCLCHTNWDIRYHGLRYFYYNEFVPPESASKICTLLYDKDGSVRLLALRLTSDMDLDLYKVALASLETSSRYSELQNGLAFLLSNNAGKQTNIIELLSSEKRMSRYIGAIAAAKSYPASIEPLKIAAQSDDIEVSDFAGKTLEGDLVSFSKH